MKFYILDKDKNVIGSDGSFEWATFMDSGERMVQQDSITGKSGAEYFISTVFTGLPSLMDRDSAKYLFETMVFDKDRNDLEQFRWDTWTESKQEHLKIVAKYRDL